MSLAKKSLFLTRGRKKTAIARVRIMPGAGSVRINGIPLAAVIPEVSRETMSEPLDVAKGILGDTYLNSLDINVNVHGGGYMGRAEAVRSAIGKSLVEWSGSDELKKLFTTYDRSMVVDDVRVKEAKKYHRKGARSKYQKSYR